MPGGIDYDERQWTVYAKGRAPSPALLELWTEAFGRYLDPARHRTVLDLGSGVGHLSVLLADAFGATVTGLEPSDRMREVAERENPHPRVRYLEGSGEAIPVADGAFDAALLSYVVHHLDDPEAAVAELRRVLRPHALVLLRSTLRDSLPRVPHCASG